MKKILFILCLVTCASIFADSLSRIPMNVSPEDLNSLLNRNFEFLERRNNAGILRIETVLDVDLSKYALKNHKHYAREIRTECPYGNMTDDDVQGQLWDLDAWKLSRYNHAVKYRTMLAHLLLGGSLASNINLGIGTDTTPSYPLQIDRTAPQIVIKNSSSAYPFAFSIPESTDPKSFKILSVGVQTEFEINTIDNRTYLSRPTVFGKNTGSAIYRYLSDDGTNFEIDCSTGLHPPKLTTENVTIIGSSYTTQFVAGDQDGDFVYTLPTSTVGRAGFHLQLSSSGAMEWQPPKTAGQDYYFSTESSDVPGYYASYSSFSAVAAGSIEKTFSDAAGVETVIGTWTTLSGYPTGDSIPSGIWKIKVWVDKTSGNEELRVHGDVYLRASGGSETFLGHTSPSAIVTSGINLYETIFTTGNIILSTGTRIVVVGVGVSEGTGGNPVADFYFGGVYPSHVDLPAPNINVNNYSLTIDIEADFAIVNSSLTDIHDNYATKVYVDDEIDDAICDYNPGSYFDNVLTSDNGAVLVSDNGNILIADGGE